MLTELQRRTLEELRADGHIGFGMYGGILNFVYRGSLIVFNTNGNTIKALLRRGLIEKRDNRIVITEAGRAALL